MAKKKEFFQDGPALGNQYDDDDMLRDHLARTLPTDILRWNELRFRLLGARAAEDILLLGKTAEASPPVHIPYDAWGKRVDLIKVSEAWEKLGRVAVAENLIGEAYERKYGAHSRIVQLARVYLFGASSALYTCPLAMTDGAARALELYGDDTLKHGAFKKLTTADSFRFWTSGQWMTEREGGSDVGNSSTVAVLDKDGGYLLSGTKWFTSAITAPMAMTLARIKGAPKGNRGLSLFYLETHDADGAWNGITIHRLKDKQGTKAVPTAELTMRRTRATLVGKEGEGVKQITAILNITRVWNAVEAIGLMRRGVALARDYAYKREVFGEKLCKQPAYVETLAWMETELRAGFALTFFVIELLGKEEIGSATAEERALLRVLTPIIKLFTAKQAVRVTDEAQECFGGMGYIEDTGIPRLVRDAGVLRIWEGTTNVLALDVLRVLEKTATLDCLVTVLKEKCGKVCSPELASLVSLLRTELVKLHCGCIMRGLERTERKQQVARQTAFVIAHIAAGALLIEQADWALQNGKGKKSLVAAKKWILEFMNHGEIGPYEESLLLAFGK